MAHDKPASGAGHTSGSVLRTVMSSAQARQQDTQDGLGHLLTGIAGMNVTGSSRPRAVVGTHTLGIDVSRQQVTGMPDLPVIPPAVAPQVAVSAGNTDKVSLERAFNAFMRHPDASTAAAWEAAYNQFNAGHHSENDKKSARQMSHLVIDHSAAGAVHPPAHEAVMPHRAVSAASGVSSAMTPSAQPGSASVAAGRVGSWGVMPRTAAGAGSARTVPPLALSRWEQERATQEAAIRRAVAMAAPLVSEIMAAHPLPPGGRLTDDDLSPRYDSTGRIAGYTRFTGGAGGFYPPPVQHSATSVPAAAGAGSGLSGTDSAPAPRVSHAQMVAADPATGGAGGSSSPGKRVRDGSSHPEESPGSRARHK